MAKTRTEQLRYAIYLRKLETNEEVAVKAEEFKGRYDVSIADSFIAAPAYLEGSAVISDDLDFKRIPETKSFTEDEFVSHLQR